MKIIPQIIAFAFPAIVAAQGNVPLTVQDHQIATQRAIDMATKQMHDMQNAGRLANPQNDPQARTRQAIENARAQALARQATDGQVGPKNGLAPQELRNLKGVDPAKLAARYNQVDGGGNKPAAGPELMVFISTSMPKEALKMLGSQAAASGAVLVLRGMKGSLGTRDLVQKTTEALQPITETGASVRIDPEAFERYSVMAVPTFVVDPESGGQGCSDDKCAAGAYSLVGDVTIRYALEHWANQGGAAARLSAPYLRRLEQSQ